MKKINTTVKIIFLSLCSGLFFWVLDAVFQYIMFRDLLREMIFTPPNNFLESLLTQIPTHSLINRIYVIVISLIGGIAISFYLRGRYKAQEELKEERDFSQNLIDTAQTIILVLDVEGKILRINPYMEDISGYTQEEVKGKDWFSTFLPHAGHTNIQDIFQKAVGGIEVNNTINSMLTKDGRECQINWHNKTLKDYYGNIIGVLSVGQDITERLQAQEKLLKNQYYLTKAQEMGNIGTWEMDIQTDSLLWTDETFRIFNVPQGTKMNLNRFMKLVHPADRDMVNENWKAGLKDGSYDLVHRLTINNRIKWVREKANFEFDSAGNPIRAIGFTQDITEQMETEKELKQYTQQLEALREASLSLTSNLSLPIVLDILLESVLHLLSADDAHIFTYDGKEVQFGAARWTDDRQPVPFAEPRQDGLTYTVARSGKPLVITDMSCHPIFQDWPLEGAIIGLPLVHKDLVIGVMNVAWDIERKFSTGELRILYLLADQAAIAINNAHLYEEIQQHLHQLKTLNTVTAALSTSLELDKVLDLILYQVEQVLPFDSGVVFLHGEDGLQVVMDHGFTPSIRGRIFPPENKLLKEIEQTKMPLILNNTEDDPRFQTWSTSGNIASWMGIPLIVRDTLIGFLTLDSHQPDSYSPAQFDFIQPLASQAAIAINNARLYERVIADANQLEKHVQERTTELKNRTRDLAQTTRELKLTKEQIEIILNNSPDGFCLLDKNANILMTNPTFCQVIGLSIENLIGHPLMEFVVDELKQEIQPKLNEFIINKERIQFEHQLRTPDGVLCDFAITLSPVFQEQEFIGIVVSIHDISQMIEVQRMKDAFVSNVSHELRTPITNFMFTLELLRRKPERQEVYLKSLDQEVKQLHNLIEDILLLSRLDQDALQLKKRPTNLNDLCAEFTFLRRPLIEENGLSLQFIPIKAIPIVQADFGLINQLLSIILTNAMNYTPQGGKIEIRTHQGKGLRKNFVGFSVYNDGPGIQSDDHQRIFERFYRGKEGLKSGKSGTGLGLSIAQEIIHRHQGEIELVSSGIEGEGTTFNIWLPVTRDGPHTSF